MVVFRHEDAAANIANATGLLGWNRQPYSGKRVCGGVSKSSSFEDEGSWHGGVLWSRPLLIVACLFPLICGYAISLSAERRLRKGMNEKAWTEQELEPLRLRLSHPVGKWLLGILIAAFGILILLSARGLYPASMIWALILPFQIMARVYQTVMSAGRSDSMLLGNNFAPIQSEHWGERS
jgi:hypothetical protein